MREEEVGELEEGTLRKEELGEFEDVGEMEGGDLRKEELGEFEEGMLRNDAFVEFEGNGGETVAKGGVDGAEGGVFGTEAVSVGGNNALDKIREEAEGELGGLGIKGLLAESGGGVAGEDGALEEGELVVGI